MEYSKILKSYETIKKVKLEDYIEIISEWDKEKVIVYENTYPILQFVNGSPGEIMGGDNHEAIIAHPFAPALKKKVQMFNAYGICYFNNSPIALFHKTNIINPLSRITYNDDLMNNFDKEIKGIKKFLREIKGSINEFYHKEEQLIHYNSVRIHKDFYMEMMKGNDVKEYHKEVEEFKPFSDIQSQQLIEEAKQWKKIFKEPLSHGEELAEYIIKNRNKNKKYF